MSEQGKPTDGPWITWWDGLLIVPESHADRRQGFSTEPMADRNEYAQIIATVHEDRHGRGDALANARLIAKARHLPALVAALESAFAYAQSQPSQDVRLERTIQNALALVQETE